MARKWLNSRHTNTPIQTNEHTQMHTHRPTVTSERRVKGGEKAIFSEGKQQQYRVELLYFCCVWVWENQHHSHVFLSKILNEKSKSDEIEQNGVGKKIVQYGWTWNLGMYNVRCTRVHRRQKHASCVPNRFKIILTVLSKVTFFFNHVFTKKKNKQFL